MIKRFFTIVLCLMLILSASAFAALSVFGETADAVSGVSGDCQWSFNPDSGELRVFGKGRMADYEAMSHTPWYEYRKQISSTVIENGVTYVGEECLQSLYSNSHKVVVFSRFTRMLKIIEKGIAALHLNYYYLDGKTQDRIAVVDEFERSNNGVFLISLKAGGTGLNLTSADTAIIYDPWWNPAAEKQAEDRIYRIGQTQNVMIYRLIIEDSVEEKVQELQKKKTELSTQLLDGHEMPLHIDSDMMRKLIMN